MIFDNSRKPEWDQIVAYIHSNDPDKIIPALEDLKKHATIANLSDLYELMEIKDWYINEPVAETISIFVGVNGLEPLLTSFGRRLAAGHDGDGAVEWIASILEAEPAKSRAILRSLSQRNDPVLLEAVEWAFKELDDIIYLNSGGAWSKTRRS